ncbi:hypothetical protein GB937_001540 [Aspergillus fischeri]|nr:hypothetical protein GB937_001540 [Aspergillus fischeri]
MARFAYKIILSDQEEAMTLPLTELLLGDFTLHNDYYSCEKENYFYQTKENKLPISNAVTLFMK